MNVMELGAIGEMIGGAAVLVTLMYLAVQLRQTKQLMRVESARSSSKEYGAFLYHLTDSEQMELFRQGFDHFESMEPNDQARLHAHLAAMFYSAQSSYTEEGVDFFATLIRSPGFAAWWAITKSIYRQDFVQHVEELAQTQKDAPLAPDFMPWYRWTESASTAGA